MALNVRQWRNGAGGESGLWVNTIDTDDGDVDIPVSGLVHGTDRVSATNPLPAALSTGTIDAVAAALGDALAAL